MPILLAVLQVLAFVAIAAAAVRPVLRRQAAALLLALGALSLAAAGMAGGTERSLAIHHHFSAYVGQLVRSKEFPIETVTAPGYLWGLLCAGFCGGWAVWLARRGVGRPFGIPLALAWTGVALQICLEKAAAPSALLSPFDLAVDRPLLPATLACALLLGRGSRKIIELVVYLTLFIAVTRLPLAVLGTIVTRGELGTHLDVHDTTYFVPPGGGNTIGGIEVDPGSAEQLFWLVWFPHLVFFPFIYTMSTGGFGFLRLMWERQREEDRRVGGAQPAAPPNSAGPPGTS